MWRNPKYPAPAGPAENGARLATFPRGQGDELRVNLDEYQGRAYISIRVWNGGYPVRGKGCSVRVSEARGVAEALLAALDELGEGREAAAAGPGPRGRRAAAVGPDPAQGACPAGGGFSES
jgi:hypothetical protein